MWELTYIRRQLEESKTYPLVLLGIEEVSLCVILHGIRDEGNRAMVAGGGGGVKAAVVEAVACGCLEGKKMADAKSLAEAPEKLTTLLTSKADGSISGGHRSSKEVVYKLVFFPTDLKLEGVANYLSWSRRTMLVVEQKDLDGYLLGTVGEPGDKASAKGKKWNVINSLLIGWLLNSMVPTAAEIWKNLSTQYSGKGNAMLIPHTDGKIRGLCQDDKSVMAYV